MAIVKQNPSAAAYRNEVYNVARRAGFRLVNVTVNVGEGYAIATDASGHKYRVKLLPKSVAKFGAWDAVNSAWSAAERLREIKRVKGEIAHLENEIRELKADQQMFGRGMMHAIRPRETRLKQFRELLLQFESERRNPTAAQLNRCKKLLDDERGTYGRPTITYNRNGVNVYAVPDRETMTRFLGKIIKNHKVGDQVEIWFKGKRYTWQKYSANGWQKVSDKEKNPTGGKGTYIVKTKSGNTIYVTNCFAITPFLAYKGLDWAMTQRIAHEPPTGAAILKDDGKAQKAFEAEVRKGKAPDQIIKDWRKARGLQNPINRKKNFSKADFRRLTKERLQELSKMFQGEATGTRIKTVAPDAMPDDTFRLGWLKKLIFKTPDGRKVSWDFSGNSLLSADIRCNLWVSGTSAQVKGLRGGLPKKPDYKVLGDLVQVEYVTAKRHIENGRTVRFWHPMGEVTKQFPKIAVDYDGFPIMIGGGYDIWNVGIVD